MMHCIALRQRPECHCGPHLRWWKLLLWSFELRSWFEIIGMSVIWWLFGGWALTPVPTR